MFRIALIACGMLAMSANVAIAALDAGEGYLIDAVSGDYTFTYRDRGTGEFKQFTFEPDKIVPFIVSTVERSEPQQVRYSYEISNASGAAQDIPGFTLTLVSNIVAPVPLYRTSQKADIHRNPQYASVMRQGEKALFTPQTWRPSVSVPLSGGREGLVIAWSRPSPERNKRIGLPPGVQQAGFGFLSTDLPGVGTVNFRGTGKRMRGYQPEANGDSMSQDTEATFRQVMAAASRFERNAAMATIEVPSPFNSLLVIEQVRAHANDWPQRQLMAEALWRRIDDLLASTIAALKAGNTSVGVVNLAQIRAELRKSYPDLDVATVVDDPQVKSLPASPEALRVFLTAHDLRLAAKVLDFDVAFVIDKLSPKVQ